MLKANSKTARENIRAYITENFTPDNYGIETPDNFTDISKIILDTCKQETTGDYYLRKFSRFERFAYWCQGLPSIFNIFEALTPEAVDILGDILEETPEERSAFEVDAAQEKLIYLIFRELERGAY